LRLASKIGIILSWVPFSLLAQQDPQFGQYMMNPYIWNPAYPALKDQYSLSFHYRSQWQGYTTSYGSDQISAPNTQLFTGTMPLTKLKSGAGIQVMNDNIGPLRNFNASLSYAYRIELGPGRLGAGVGIGVSSLYLNPDLWRAENPNDPTLSASNYNSLNQLKPNFRVGLAYADDKFYLGLSVNNVATPTYSFSTASIESKLVRHYYLQSSYLFALDENINMQPSLLLKNISGVTSYELSDLFYFHKVWFGLSYRSSDALIALAGIHLLRDNSLKLGYNIDFSVINTTAKSLTSHEIYISYNLGSFLDNRKPIVRSPRFRF
jgi:type IX secretion system PorP/SprF family membrane protein